jgi:glycerol uptake facilitator-like aquaporin
MISIYILEFIGTATLAFLISLLGKGYAHILLGTTLLVTGTLFANNCFNPAIALCYLLTNHITFTAFIYYIMIELSGAVMGFFFGSHVKTLYL